MSTFNMDLKFDKLTQLSDVFKNENINNHGVYHIQRNIQEMTKDKMLLVAAHDINKMYEAFSKGDITYGSYVEKQSVQILSLTLRLESGSILKYVISANTSLENRLRLNFSVEGRVFEYDDANSYLNTNLQVRKETLLEHHEKTREIAKRIEEVIYD